MRAMLQDLDENHLVVRARSLVVRGLLEKIDRDGDDPFRAADPELPTFPGEEDSNSSVDPFDTERRGELGDGMRNSTFTDGEAESDAEWAQVSKGFCFHAHAYADLHRYGAWIM